MSIYHTGVMSKSGAGDLLSLVKISPNLISRYTVYLLIKKNGIHNLICMHSCQD